MPGTCAHLSHGTRIFPGEPGGPAGVREAAGTPGRLARQPGGDITAWYRDRPANRRLPIAAQGRASRWRSRTRRLSGASISQL